MERDFRYLRDKHGDAGAREIFEKICSELITAKFGADAHNIRVSQGDGGIDVIVGDTSSPSDVFQCKYFIDGIADSQKSQIRESFNTAISSSIYKMKRWVLCLPSIFSLKELEWWSGWKNNQQERHPQLFIEVWDATYLLNEMRESAILNTVFDDDVRNALTEILASLSIQRQRVQDETIAFIRDPSSLGYQNAVFVKKLENAQIREIDGCKRDFFLAECAEHALKSKGNQGDISQLNNLKYKVLGLWETQYRFYQHEHDGNKLITGVYERIENLDTSTLQTTLSELNLFVKRGVLHQFAEDCSVGWIKDYKEKLEAYLKEVGSDAEQ